MHKNEKIAYMQKCSDSVDGIWASEPSIDDFFENCGGIETFSDEERAAFIDLWEFIETSEIIMENGDDFVRYSKDQDIYGVFMDGCWGETCGIVFVASKSEAFDILKRKE